MNNIIKKLEERKVLIQEKLVKRREDVEGQDVPMQSIGITATRWMVK